MHTYSINVYQHHKLVDKIYENFYSMHFVTLPLTVNELIKNKLIF